MDLMIQEQRALIMVVFDDRDKNVPIIVVLRNPLQFELQELFLVTGDRRDILTGKQLPAGLWSASDRSRTGGDQSGAEGSAGDGRGEGRGGEGHGANPLRKFKQLLSKVSSTLNLGCLRPRNCSIIIDSRGPPSA